MAKSAALPNRIYRPEGKAIASWLLPGLLTVIILTFQWRFMTEAGALWCDEANSATLVAACRTPADILPMSRCDSFPALWFLLLWGWTKIIGPGDQSIRVLGFCVGCLVWASLWFAAWRLTRRPPLLSLLLLGFNPLFVRTLCANRAYGLGAALLILLFVAVWQAAETPTLRRVAFAFAIMLAAIHTIYYHALFLACLLLAASLVCVLRRRWKTAALLPALGVVAGSTLAIYLPAIQHQRLYGTVGIETDLPLIAQTFQTLTAAPLPFFGLLWHALLVLALVLGLVSVSFRNRKPAVTGLGGPRLVYGALALLLLMGCYVRFLETLHYGVQPRYFVIPLALAALCLEMAFCELGVAVSRALPALRRPIAAGGRVSLAALALFALLPAWQGIGGRQTNVDFVARVLMQEAQPGDLIIVSPMYPGATFYRYYHGAAAWHVLPDVPTSQTGLEDVAYLARDMKTPRSLDSLFQAVQRTLRQKHRVWVVSDHAVLTPPPGLPVLSRWAAIQGPDSYTLYRLYCDQRFAGLVAAHARQTEDWSNLIPASETHAHEENCDYLEAVSGFNP